ncbi:MAG: sensor histidine kinase [Christensenellales bacterium]|jgi:signal transduction histidine kinase
MIRGYLLSRRALFVFFLLVVFFFALVYFLYDLDMRPIAYSLVILTFIFCGYIAVDAVRFASKARVLENIQKNLSASSSDFPRPSGCIEEQYQRIIETLYAIIQRTCDELSGAHSEQMDYYTMWMHQIKVPISAMQMALESQDHPDPVMRQELFRVDQYVEMALAYVKMRQMASDLVIRPYRIDEIVRDSIRKYSPLFIYKKLHISAGGEKAQVCTDSKWLGFVFEQVLSNAVKYTQPGGTITVVYDEHALSVEDTGIGIRQEDMHRIFEKGYTGYNGRLDKRASGLGLYMAKRVADALSVNIRIKSTLGEGTKVRLVLPRRDEMDIGQ